jgi:hypothetical protein
MPRAQTLDPRCLKSIEKYLPRCLALILFTCSLTSLAFPPAPGHSGEHPQSNAGTDFMKGANIPMFAATGGGCSGPIFGAASTAVGIENGNTVAWHSWHH